MPQNVHAYFNICTVSVFLFFQNLAAQEIQKYNLEYHFRKGDRLQYKTERIDSINTSFGGQTMQRKMTIWSLESLSVFDTPPNKPYTLSIKTDTTWSDQNEGSMPAPGGSGFNRPRGSGQPRGPGDGQMRRFGAREEQQIQINPNGQFVSKEQIISPFLFPLPESPIPKNGTWEYQIQTESQGRRPASTISRGQCLLYDVDTGSGKNIAIIIVNSETKRNSEFSISTPEGDMRGSSAMTTNGTYLVYFDIDAGHIIETVTDESSESANESSRGSSSSSSVSKSTIKLVSGK